MRGMAMSGKYLATSMRRSHPPLTVFAQTGSIHRCDAPTTIATRSNVIETDQVALDAHVAQAPLVTVSITTVRSVLFSTLTATVSLACGSATGAAVAPQLSIAGDYPTTVAITRDDCGGSVVQSNPTVVTHVPGSGSLELQHAGSTYKGAVQSTGEFATSPASTAIAGASYIVALNGKFTISGFTATVTVDKTDSAHPSGCRYIVSWSATRASGTNVIPG